MTPHVPTLRRGLVFLLGLCLALPAAHAAAQEVEGEIVESQRRLEQIRHEREQLQSEMSRIQSQVTDLSTEVRNLERQAGASAALLEELEFQAVQREEQIRRNTYELLMTRDRLAERRAVLQRRLRDIYKRGPLQTMEVLLRAESFADLLNRYKYLHLIARHDRRLAEEVAELERQLVARERALRSNLSQLAAVRVERIQEHGQLAVLQQHQRQALTGVRAREQVTAARIEQLERDVARLAAMIETLEGRRREAEAGRPAAEPVLAALTPASMGTLEWPVDGPLLYPYGRVLQPNGTALRWNGIGIGAPPGTPVRAVEGGSVALAGPFEGYGPTVIISHGGGYYTLYLYLREITVQAGEAVRRGESVGTVGGEDTPEGSRIEFQVRVPGGQAVDPRPWLRERNR
jgi:murein hydrolase activator